MLTGQPWKIESLLQLLLGIFGSITFAGLLAAALGYHAQAGYIDHVMMLVGALSVHGVGVLWLHWFIKDHRTNWPEVLGSHSSGVWPVVIVSLAFGFAGFVGCLYIGNLQAWIFSLFAVEPEPQQTIVALQSSLSIPWTIAFGTITIALAPFVEEILFRGILYPTIKSLGYRRTAIWGTSVGFAAIHANLNAFIPLTLLALGLVWLYEKTGRLIAPIIAHATFNAINFGMTVYLRNPGPGVS